jgi:hypothetical protein
MQKYTYKIISVDLIQHTMTVKYTPDNIALSEYAFNIKAPDDMNNLDTYINNNAPQDSWSAELNPNLYLANIIGQTGNIDPASLTVAVNGEAYDMMSQLNDEFLAEQSNTAGV